MFEDFFYKSILKKQWEDKKTEEDAGGDFAIDAVEKVSEEKKKVELKDNEKRYKSEHTRRKPKATDSEKKAAGCHHLKT